MTVIYAIFCLIIFPFISKNLRYKIIKYWCQHFVWITKIICGIKYNIIGLENLSKTNNNLIKNDNLIILSNHQSAWETIAFIGLLPVRLCYVFKQELLYIPFFGWVLGMLDMLHINRKHGSRAFAHLAKQTQIKLNLGYVPILFPQGTRSLPYQNLPYKTGGTRLALQNEAIIIPISHNAGEMWAKNSFTKKSGTINIHIGQGITSKNKTLEQLNIEIKTYIENHIIYNDKKNSV